MLAWDTFKDAPLRPAAALLIVAEQPELQVLLGLRNKNLKFMGGHHVFPGGGIHVDDNAALVHGADDEEVARAIFAAAREAFEECGILSVRGELPTATQRREARMALLRKETTFASLLCNW